MPPFRTRPIDLMTPAREGTQPDVSDLPVMIGRRLLEAYRTPSPDAITMGLGQGRSVTVDPGAFAGVGSIGRKALLRRAAGQAMAKKEVAPLTLEEIRGVSRLPAAARGTFEGTLYGRPPQEVLVEIMKKRIIKKHNLKRDPVSTTAAKPKQGKFPRPAEAAPAGKEWVWYPSVGDKGGFVLMDKVK